MNKLTIAERKELNLLLSYYCSLDTSKEEQLIVSGLTKLLKRLN